MGVPVQKVKLARYKVGKKITARYYLRDLIHNGTREPQVLGEKNLLDTKQLTHLPPMLEPGLTSWPFYRRSSCSSVISKSTTAAA